MVELVVQRTMEHRRSCWGAAVLLLLMGMGLALDVHSQTDRKDLPQSIELRGNLVFGADAYLAILQLDKQVWSRRGRPRVVSEYLESFLHRAGYVLATVAVKRQGKKMLVVVDEGRLDRVIFLGVGSLKALQLKARLAIPQNVYNKRSLDRQLRELGAEGGLKNVHYELVGCPDIDHAGPQVTDLGSWLGQPVILPRAGYELHITLSKNEWGTGLGLDARYAFPDGFKFNLRFRDEDLLFTRDRWQVAAGAAGELRKNLDDGKTYPALTRARLGLRWFTPPLIGDGFRPMIEVVSDLVSRQRADLDLEIYYRERLDGSLRFSYEMAKGLAASLGGGAEQRWIFGLKMADSATTTLPEGSWFRPYLAARLNFDFDPLQVRKDRHHHLWLEIRHHWVDGSDSLGRANYFYRKVFGLGWHDLVVSSRGVWLWGELLFDDLVSVGGRHLRAVFGGDYWVERVASLTLEFRFSIVRDLFKLSIFHDLACFGQLDPVNGSQKARVADSFGLGFHALVLDLFQFDIYYGVGFSSDGEFDHGITGALTKVF